jgi:hypothetical protein
MALDSRTALTPTGDVPITSKEVELTRSASVSENESHLSRKWYQKGTTFAAHGLRQENYKPVDTYEGIHRYDADFEWEPEEERKVIRKV